jgi:hypothetical protein
MKILPTPLLTRPTEAEKLPELFLSEVSKVFLLCGWIKWDYNPKDYSFFIFVWQAIECVCHSFANVAHFVSSRDDWIRTQRAAVASRCATNLATHLPGQLNHAPISLLCHPSPYLATRLPT